FPILRRTVAAEPLGHRFLSAASSTTMVTSLLNAVKTSPALIHVGSRAICWTKSFSVRPRFCSYSCNRFSRDAIVESLFAIAVIDSRFLFWQAFKSAVKDDIRESGMVCCSWLLLSSSLYIVSRRLHLSLSSLLLFRNSLTSLWWIRLV